MGKRHDTGVGRVKMSLDLVILNLKYLEVIHMLLKVYRGLESINMEKKM